MEIDFLKHRSHRPVLVYQLPKQYVFYRIRVVYWIMAIINLIN
ncbi:hypothetical protein BLA29_013512 [Euroglyphus maynei]|uniref:Uncharacterized protein n=1 Tax=Euroglyphus maynei TaxID=6958 RepID=A0A1Y3AUB5_EURMA|nr:hypothetical protein BLA29_013512 [Euroglyphus maynei]